MSEPLQIEGRARPWTTWAILALATLGGLAIRLYHLGYAELDIDEQYTYKFASAGSAALLGKSFQIETNPPLYYLLQWAWLVFGSDEFTMRTLPVLMGTLTIPLLYVTARRIVGERAALIAAILIASAPLPIYYSRYIRCYGLLLFAAMASVACFVWLLPANVFRGASDDLAETREPGRWSSGFLWLGYTLSLLVCFYSHSTMVLLPCMYLVAVGLLWVVFRRVGWGFVGCWAIATGVAVVLYLPWLMVSIHQAQEILLTLWYPKPSLTLAYTQILGTYPYPRLFKPLAYLLPLIGLWRIRRSPLAVSFVLVFLAGLPLLTFSISYYRPIFNVRTIFWPSFFFYILMGAALAMPKKVWVSGLGILAIIGLHGMELSSQIRQQPDQPDPPKIVQILREHMKATDALLVSPVTGLPNELDYASRYDKLPAADRYYVSYDDVRNRLDEWIHVKYLRLSEAHTVLSRYPRVWVVCAIRPKFPTPSFVPIDPIIAEGLGKDYREVNHWELADYHVYLHERTK